MQTSKSASGPYMQSYDMITDLERPHSQQDHRIIRVGVIWVGMGYAPQDNGDQDGSKEARRCHACKARGHLKRDCSTHKLVKLAAVAGNAARSSENTQTEKAECRLGLHRMVEKKRLQRAMETLAPGLEWKK